MRAFFVEDFSGKKFFQKFLTRAFVRNFLQEGKRGKATFDTLGNFCGRDDEVRKECLYLLPLIRQSISD